MLHADIQETEGSAVRLQLLPSRTNAHFTIKATGRVLLRHGQRELIPFPLLFSFY